MSSFYNPYLHRKKLFKHLNRMASESYFIPFISSFNRGPFKARMISVNHNIKYNLNNCKSYCYEGIILYSDFFHKSNLVACLGILAMRRVWKVNQENAMGLDLNNLHVLLPGMIHLVHMQNFRKTSISYSLIHTYMYVPEGKKIRF